MEYARAATSNPEFTKGEKSCCCAQNFHSTATYCHMHLARTLPVYPVKLSQSFRETAKQTKFHTNASLELGGLSLPRQNSCFVQEHEGAVMKTRALNTVLLSHNSVDDIDALSSQVYSQIVIADMLR